VANKEYLQTETEGEIEVQVAALARVPLRGCSGELVFAAV
jgi:hypothetical protein